ncbi:MAG: ABC transporter ATP-binding protein [Thermodesulfobacteriota bacterium]
MKAPVLRTEKLSINFGGLKALSEVEFEIHEGEVVALIGPNGAGKTTFFNLLSGFLKPSAGRVFFEEREITGLSPHAICRRGISRTFQKTSIFQELTVFENLRLGVQTGHGKRNEFWRSATSDTTVTKAVHGLLELVGFEDKADTMAQNLSHGDQRLIEVLLGLSTKPRLLLLDEPAAGLSVRETRNMIAHMKELSRNTIKNIVIVEHDMEVVTELATTIYVLHQGEVLCKGSVEDIKSNSRVQDVYLGRLN